MLNVTIPTNLLGGDGKFRFGGKLRVCDKIDQPNNLSYEGVPATSLSSLRGPGPFTNYYNGTYNIGYAPDLYALRTIFAGLTPFTSASNAQRNASGFFNGTENIHAGYGEYSGTSASWVCSRPSESRTRTAPIAAPRLSFLPAPFDGLGAIGNVRDVWSRLQIRPGENSRLPGTSPLTYNLGLFYEAHKAQLRLSLSHVDAAIFEVGGGPGFDTFEDQRTQLDLTSTHQLFRHMAIYFNARNLNNSPLRYVSGSAAAHCDHAKEPGYVTHTIDVPHLGDQLRAKGLTWNALYAGKHNGFVSFRDVQSDAGECTGRRGWCI